MGLKEKAVGIQNANIIKKKGQIDPDADKYISKTADEEKILDLLKKKGIINKEDLFKNGSTALDHDLSQFLLPEDLLGSTIPSESDYSLNSRIEALINLIELCKELATSEDAGELWESILFSILGQIGTREAAIFIKEENRFNIKASKGYIFPENVQFSKRSGIERIFAKDLNIHYSHKILDNISGDELNLFKSLKAEIFIPVVHFEELLGFIIIGKPIGSSDFSIEDLLYLKLLGEVIGSFYTTIRFIEQINAQRETWNFREKIYQKYIYFQQELQSSTDPDSTRLLFEQYLKETFTFQAYAFFVLNEKEEYSVDSCSGISKDSFKNINFRPGDSLLYKLQQNHTWFEDNSILEEPEISRKLLKEEKAIFSNTLILPLFFHGSLYGFFLLLKTSPEFPYDLLNYAQNMITTYYWYYLSHTYLKKSEKNLNIAITDPLHGVKSALEKQEIKLEKKGKSFAVLLVNIINFNRLENLYGEKFAVSAVKKVKTFCDKEMENVKFLSDIFVDKFMVVFEDIDKSQLWLTEKSLHKRISDLFPEEHKRPLIHNRLYARPEDKKKTLDQLLVF
jgi:GGDEF domain-containing protein